jgi:hypothetical protein
MNDARGRGRECVGWVPVDPFRLGRRWDSAFVVNLGTGSRSHQNYIAGVIYKTILENRPGSGNHRTLYYDRLA